MTTATRGNTKTKKSGISKIVIFLILIFCILFEVIKFVELKNNNIDDLEDSGSVTSLDNPESNDSIEFNQATAYEIKDKFNSNQMSLNNAINALSQDDSRISEVYNHIDDYPEDILKLLVENPETRKFVLEYPQHLNDKGAGKLIEDEKNGSIPHFLQWDKRWGYSKYGCSVLGVTGCGPTCLSMIIIGLLNDYEATPSAVAKFSEDNGYYVDGKGSSWDLMISGAASYGLNSQEIPLSEESMVVELQSGHPLVINVCPGDFTTVGHFMVITDYKDGMFTINDPNSNAISKQGWDYETLARQTMNIWAFSVT